MKDILAAIAMLAALFSRAHAQVFEGGGSGSLAIGSTPITGGLTGNFLTIGAGGLLGSSASSASIAFPQAATGATSGGVVCATSTTSLTMSAALSAGALVVGGGAGVCPSTVAWNIIGGPAKFDQVVGGPVVLNVKSAAYGAKGGAKHFGAGSTTISTTAFTDSTNSPFLSTDCQTGTGCTGTNGNKVISINFAGNSGGTANLSTTIAGYTSASTITLGTNALSSQSNVDYIYGTDDTAAVQAAVNAIGGGVGKVYFPYDNYIINGAFGGSAPYAQIVLPSVGNGAAISGEIEFIGDTPTNSENYVVNDLGSILWSTQNGSTNAQCVIGAYNASGPNGQSNILFKMKDMTIYTGINPTNSGVCAGGVQQLKFEGIVNISPMVAFTYYINGGVGGHGGLAPSTSGGTGLITPYESNNALVEIDTVSVFGFNTNYYLGEHTKVENLNSAYSNNCLSQQASFHDSVIVRAQVQGCIYTVTYAQSSQDGELRIHNLNIQHSTSTNGQNFITTADINDAGNYGRGIVDYNVVKAGVGIDHTFTVSGGTGVTFTDDSIPYSTTYANAPGVLSGAPAYLGQIHRFTDSAITVIGQPIAGSGSSAVVGQWNGTNWLVVSASIGAPALSASTSPISWSLGASPTATVTLVSGTGPYTLTPTGMVAGGGPYNIEIIQPASGSTQTVGTWSNVTWPSGTAPTLTATLGAKDIVSCLSFDGSTLQCVWQGYFH
jgi:hypothetical protein